MQPINPIAVILIFGLQLVVMGVGVDSKSYKIMGSIIMLVGWILNTVANFTKLG